MQGLRQFSIPIKGLDSGIHEFTLDIDSHFFGQFESSPYEEGKLELKLRLDKKSDHIALFFNMEGYVVAECDRCTDLMNCPVIVDEAKLIIKYDESERDEGDIIYIHPESHELNVAKLVYDQLILNVPMFKACEMDTIESKTCNEKVLSVLDNEQEKNSGSSLLGDALKDFKIKAK